MTSIKKFPRSYFNEYWAYCLSFSSLLLYNFIFPEKLILFFVFVLARQRIQISYDIRVYTKFLGLTIS